MAEIKQRMVTCPQGHTYDANQYASCPTCSGAVPAGGGFYAPGGSGAFPKTEAPTQGSMGFEQGGVGFAQGNGNFPRTQPPGNQQPYYNDGFNNPVNGNFGKTQPPNRQNGSGRFSPTVRVSKDTPAGSPLPVVGWLVAVDGPCRGTELRLVEGTNRIGRGDHNDVCIRWDNTISADANSAITYNSDDRKFYIAHLYGHGRTKLNNRDVSGGDRELTSLDKVTIGSSNFVFVGLCGPRFDWSNIAEHKNG